MHTHHTGILLGLLLLLGALPGARAQGEVRPPSWDTTVRVSDLQNDPRTHYETVSTITTAGIDVPTVVEVPLYAPHPVLASLSPLAVVLDGAGVIVPSYVRTTATTTRTPLIVTTETGEGRVLTDKKLSTGITFTLPESRTGLATLLVVPQSEMTMSGITLALGKNVTPPTHVEIRARDTESKETILLSRTRYVGNTIVFLPTRVSQLLVYLEYGQPLEITEVDVIEENPPMTTAYSLRFLAEPNVSYSIYALPDTAPQVPRENTSNLMGDAGVYVYRLEDMQTTPNAMYAPADSDKDGIPNKADNCPSNPNPDQRDTNRDGVGDPCDDYDRDGYPNDTDNCPNNANTDQRDTDGDGEGDTCDTYENRFTERLPWVPWVGIGFAGLILAGLFAVVLRQSKQV